MYSIDEVDRGTPTKAPNMMLERSANSRTRGYWPGLLAGKSWLSCSLILMAAQPSGLKYLVRDPTPES